MPLETVLFDLDHVLVTSRRFSVRHRSFSLNSIRAFRLAEHSRSWLPAIVAVSLAGVAGVAALAAASLGLGITALVFLGLATAAYLFGGPHFSIVLDTRDGEFTPLTSSSRFLVAGVASVLQSALLHSGATARTSSFPVASPAAPAILGPLAAQPTASASWLRGGFVQPGSGPLHNLHVVCRRALHFRKTA